MRQSAQVSLLNMYMALWAPINRSITLVPECPHPDGWAGVGAGWARGHGARFTVR